MNALWQAIGAQIMGHLVAIEAALGTFAISAIFAWPVEVPQCFKRFIDPALWTWARDAVQGAIPLKFRDPHPSTPQQPAGPAQEQK